MKNIPHTSISLVSEEFIDDPHTICRKWRIESPLLYSTAHDCVLVTRHRNVRDVLSRYELFSANRGIFLDFDLTYDAAKVRDLPMWLLDPPDHSRLRSYASQTFLNRITAQHVGAFEAIGRTALRRLAEAGRAFDVVDDFAIPTVIACLAALLELPERDRAEFSGILQDTIQRGSSPLAEAGTTLQEVPSEYIFQQHRAYFSRYVALMQKQDGGGEGLSGAAIGAEVAGEPMTDDEMVSMINFGVFAGFEDMVRILASTIYAIWKERDGAAALQANDAKAIPGFVDETMRYYPSTQYLRRTVVEDMEYEGVRLPKGTRIVGLIVSANRDDAAFARPDEFLPGRPDARNSLMFGFGPHMCVGQKIARSIIAALTGALVQSCEAFELAPQNALKIGGNNTYGFGRLPLFIDA